MDPGSPLRSGRGDAEGKPGGNLHESQTGAAGINLLQAVETAAGDAEAASRPGRITIRFTRTEADIAARVEMARRAYEEMDDRLPFDGALVRRLFERKLGRPDQCLLQAELDSRLVGGLIGAVAPHYHSPALGATIMGYYVLPEHRGSLAAVKLLHGFRRWARMQGAVHMHIGVTSGIDAARTDRLLRRLGFAFTGGNYMCRL